MLDSTDSTTETEAEEKEPLSVRGAIEAAIEEHSAPEEPETAPEPVLAETGDEESKPAEEVDAPVTFPASLRADERAQLMTLPKEAQRKVADVLARRESDVVRYLHQKSQEIAQKERNYQSLDAALEPVAQDWKLRGIDPAAKIKTYVEFEQLLERQPERAVAWLADEYAVDLRALMQARASTPQVDPRVKDLESKVNELTQTLTSREQAQKNAESQKLVQQMQSWATAADHNGQLLRPYAVEMLGQIASQADAIMDANPGASVEAALNHAYEQLLWANPQTRQVLLSQQVEAEKRKLQESQKARVQAARNRAVSVAGTSVATNGNSNTQKRSIRETIEAAMRGEI